MFKNDGRYSVPSIEDSEPGSNGEVLKNYLGVQSKEQMDDIENQELERVEYELIDFFDQDHQFTEKDIRYIHDAWLGDVYPCAGKYRTVSMTKNGFPFAAPNLIQKLMQDLEKNFLKKYTPCHFEDMQELAEAIGIVHVELIIIHPFREGNGRTARLLADLMAMQSNKPYLNYASIDQLENREGFNRYIAAIHAGHQGNYVPIIEIFHTLILESIEIT